MPCFVCADRIYFPVCACICAGGAGGAAGAGTDGDVEDAAILQKLQDLSGAMTDACCSGVRTLHVSC